MLVHKKAQCSVVQKVRELEASGWARVPSELYWLTTREYGSTEETPFCSTYKTFTSRYAAVPTAEYWTTVQIIEIANAIEKLYPDAYKTVKRSLVLRALFEEGFDAQLIIAADGKK